MKRRSGSGGRQTMRRFRQILSQTHWIVGITAGSVLMLIGLTGAVLSFRAEIVDLLNPGGRHVPASLQSVLTPAQLMTIAGETFKGRQIGTLTVYAEQGAAARVNLGDQVTYLNPYTGAALPHLQGDAFFEWVEMLHRWLLLPRESGRVVTGVLAAGLLLLSLSGLILRWPRGRALNWRAWLTFNTRLKGRAFLWSLHSVLGTFTLIVYLVFTSTGLYWAFDSIRDGVDKTVGEKRIPQQRGGADSVDLTPIWVVFQERAVWSEAIIRVQKDSVLFTWLDADPAHDRARNRMVVQMPSGAVIRDERYVNKSLPAQIVSSFYAVHTGSYLGLAGRILAMLAALLLPVFGVTGWMMYLQRRARAAPARVTATAP